MSLADIQQALAEFVQKSIGYVLNIFQSLAISVINLLPNSQGLPDDVLNSFQLAANYAMSFNWLLPIDTMFQILTLTGTIYLGIGIFKSVNYVLNRIWGNG
jgi:hypothetical protein